jgi:hypothetical protein
LDAGIEGVKSENGIYLSPLCDRAYDKRYVTGNEKAEILSLN